jgi:hypothetical protein
VYVSNPGQEDADGEGTGDACDLRFRKISAGRYLRTYGVVETSGALVCWSPATGVPGREFDAQLGRLIFPPDGRPPPTPPAGAFIDVVAAASDGTFCSLRQDGSATCWGGRDGSSWQVPQGAFTQISARDRFVCGLRSDGSASCVYPGRAQAQMDLPRLPSCV